MAAKRSEKGSENSGFLRGERLLCGLEGKPFEALNMKNGRSKPSLRGVRDIFESVYDDLIIVDRKKRDFKLVNADKKQIATIPRTRSAALDFSFSPQKICVSESGGSIRCYNPYSGQQLWEYNPGNGVHALDLAFHESTNAFVAITWPYQKGGEHQLVTLNPSDGEVLLMTSVSSTYEFEFCCKGSLLISSDGTIRSTATGDVQGVLNFFPGTDKSG